MPEFRPFGTMVGDAGRVLLQGGAQLAQIGDVAAHLRANFAGQSQVVVLWTGLAIPGGTMCCGDECAGCNNVTGTGPTEACVTVPTHPTAVPNPPPPPPGTFPDFNAAVFPLGWFTGFDSGSLTWAANLGGSVGERSPLRWFASVNTAKDALVSTPDQLQLHLLLVVNSGATWQKTGDFWTHGAPFAPPAPVLAIPIGPAL